MENCRTVVDSLAPGHENPRVEERCRTFLLKRTFFKGTFPPCGRCVKATEEKTGIYIFFPMLWVRNHWGWAVTGVGGVYLSRTLFREVLHLKNWHVVKWFSHPGFKDSNAQNYWRKKKKAFHLMTSFRDSTQGPAWCFGLTPKIDLNLVPSSQPFTHANICSILHCACTCLELNQRTLALCVTDREDSLHSHDGRRGNSVSSRR